MENKEDYKRNLARKLLAEFRIKFKEKVGYTPIIIDRYYSNKINLKLLEKIIKPFLPKGFKLQTKSRKRIFLHWKFIFISIARESGYGASEIGRFLKNHHSTIMYAETQIPVYMNYDNFIQDLEKINRLVYEKSNRISSEEEDNS